MSDVIRDVGPDHIAVAEARELLGRVLSTAARHDAAIAEYRTALEIRRSADIGAAEAGPTRLNLAAALDLAGRPEDALAEYRSFLAHARAASAEGRIVRALPGAISAARRLGRLDEAAADLAELKRVSAPHLDSPIIAALVELGEAIAGESREGVVRARDRLRLLSYSAGVSTADAWLTAQGDPGLSSDP